MVKLAHPGLAAQNESLETDSQFHLAVEAVHKFALAALRREAIDLKIGSVEDVWRPNYDGAPND